MGKAKNKGAASEEAPEEEEEEKAQPVTLPLVDISCERAEGKGQAGGVSVPEPTVTPVLPAPRKRGRPRKVVPKVEESTPLTLQQSMATGTVDTESKKLKVETPSTRNGSSQKDQAHSNVKLNTRAPLRREGSRRKSEPRRAAD